MSSNTPAKRSFEDMIPTPIKESDRVRDDAYKISIKPVNEKEVNYPYIPISYYHMNPIEKRYESLNPWEIAEYYTEHHSGAPFLPKTFEYYQAILSETRSVEIIPTERTGHQWAYSKFLIKNIITSEQWGDSLLRQKELQYGRPKWYSYFDYIQAWTGALLYENRQKKFSWFIQFQLEKEVKEFPPWFHEWFFNWGIFPIMLPDKVRTVYKQFTEVNKSLENPRLDFTIQYKVPWIAKWDYILTTKRSKKFEEFAINNVKWLTRRVMTKWWDKFDFFGTSSVHYYQGLIQLVKQPEKSSDKSKLTHLLKELFHSLPKEELKRRLSSALEELSDNEASSGKPKEKGECSRSKFKRAKSSDSSDEDMLSDSLFQDSQNPEDPEEATWP